VRALLAAAAEGARVPVGRALSRIVDPLVVGSFDRTGFRIHSLAFAAGDLDVDLSGRRCLVTGANSGIGFEASVALVERGATVVLLCRSESRGEQALERLRARTGGGRAELELLDVSDLGSVRRLATKLAGSTIDVLVHNAGVLPAERVETADGLELCFATHVAGPFLLTRLLSAELERSAEGRIVWVSSGGMYTRRLQVDDPNWQVRPYDGVLAYAETKRAQVVLAELFAEQFRGTRLTVNAMHPGWADTPAVRSSLPRFHQLTRWILRTPAEGADTVTWLAVSRRARRFTGQFFFDREARRTHWLPTTRESRAERQAFWRLCEIATAGAPAEVVPSPGRA
jgi:NAD(P)-dependent dehydrogenase (short-subunit alcohol dehydrogenase family)